MIEKNTGRRNIRSSGDVGEEAQGIVIADGRGNEDEHGVPRISAFIWGGKVRPSPILRFGRWKGAA